MKKTFSLKPKDVTRKWYLLDASEAPIGRLATVAAKLLIGKEKPTLSPHVDAGDYVVVINTESLVATGNKPEGKIYYRHSGFPGGIRKHTLNEAMSKDPENVIRHAVRGMLPVNKLRKDRLARLKIYGASEHTHQGQNPEIVSLKRNK